MKRLILTLLILLPTLDLMAQRYYTTDDRSALEIHLANQTTRSVYGVKTGLNLGLSYKERWGLAYFNHVSIAKDEHASNEFRGVNISYTINPKAHMQLRLNSYLGYHNKTFLSMQQTIALNYKINDKYFVSGELGRCDGLPYFGFQAGIVLISYHRR